LKTSIPTTNPHRKICDGRRIPFLEVAIGIVPWIALEKTLGVLHTYSPVTDHIGIGVVIFRGEKSTIKGISQYDIQNHAKKTVN
jgi:hypothetical protein